LTAKAHLALDEEAMAMQFGEDDAKVPKMLSPGLAVD